MAIYHHSASVVKRSSGKSAVAGAAYRSGEKIIDQRTGITHDYTKKTGVDHSEIITPHMPTVTPNWLLDRAQLWNRVEAFEKRPDSQLAREINIAIPTELDRPTQIALVHEYVKTNYIDRGMVADVNFHDLESNNPHAHIMLTMRDLIVTNGQVEFGNKNRDWNSKDLLIEQRQSWETLANQYLAAAGHEHIRIDCRSLVEQGIKRIPQIHLGTDVNAMRKKGIPTERGNLYDQIDRANAEIKARLEEAYQLEISLSNIQQQEPTVRIPIREQQRAKSVDLSAYVRFEPSMRELRRAYQYFKNINELDRAAEIKEVGEKLSSKYEFVGTTPGDYTNEEISIELYKIPKHLRDENYHQQEQKPTQNRGHGMSR